MSYAGVEVRRLASAERPQLRELLAREWGGMRLVAIHLGAVDEARGLKPSIPEVAPDGTRISDEYEFELLLEA